MGNVLIVGEQLDGELKSATYNAVTFAKKVAEHAGGDVIGLVIGHNVSAAAETLAKTGVAKVLKSDDEDLAKYMAETFATVVKTVVDDNDVSHVVATSTTFGKDLLPRVAALLDAGMASDVSAVESATKFHRPMVAGNAIAAVEVLTEMVVASCRQTEWDAAEPGDAAATIEEADGGDFETYDAEVEGVEIVKSDRPDLAEANVVVSGGRGMKSGENFSHVEALADAFGGAMGATRAACDAGMVANDLQVGQTGKVVAPDLYVAVGVSGAIQHLAGMKSSKVIVAINKDEEAPIFEVADYGLVAKWEDTLDAFTDKVKAAKS
jgi:electron transfer flavoprotein alpha subunit